VCPAPFFRFQCTPLTAFAGAFAFFGPGKFKNVYRSLTHPAADGRLHFAGEAVSVRHAWVEGALGSAWRAVFTLLMTEPAYFHLLGKFIANWGENAEWIVKPPAQKEPAAGRSPDEAQSGWGATGADNVDVNAVLQSSLLLRHLAVFNPDL
jgi:hypothetical protein